ncbi:MAG: UDP-2,4-diacetamido-2,4,6-trideoxy-beta-L-altropyranose hydrolase [Gammaproteobacteria bacterium]|nr:UDP-2,4-diacetamido-2,4,6-trideoxy-beta-L-altropyranose hydrolase [Gammaproteobacteria bacterium]
MTETSPSILFRVDAHAQMGTGHLMRCLALAEIFEQQGLRCLFACASCPAALQLRLQQAGMGFLPLQETEDSEALAVLQPQLLVVDGYHFSSAYRQRLSRLAERVLVLDDGAASHPDQAQLHASHVLNSSAQARPEDYCQRAAGAELLLGIEYAPLRQEFLQIERPSQPSQPVQPNRVLISFGGSDILNLGLRLSQRLLDCHPQLCIDLVIGAAASDQQADKLADDLLARHAPRLQLQRNCQQMARLMGQAELAISAAGSTLLELAYMAVPSIALVVADNQAPALLSPYSQWFHSLDFRRQQDLDRLCQLTLEQLANHASLQQQRQALKQLPVAQKTRQIPCMLGFQNLNQEPQTP